MPEYGDRVKETTTTAGTGAVTLAGAVADFQSFGQAFADGAQVAYTITDNVTSWEVGIGIFTAAGPSLSRDTVLSSSNAGLLVNFGAGSKDVFNTLPATEVDVSGFVPNAYASGIVTTVPADKNLIYVQGLTMNGTSSVVLLGANAIVGLA